MEIAVLLLLTVPLTATSPLRPAPSFDQDTSVAEVKASGLGRSEEAREQQRLSFLKIVPFNEIFILLLLLLFLHDMNGFSPFANSSAVRQLRQRRAPQAGCKLGTCHVHNLANTLYHMSKTSGKEKSKNANDPQGYGK
uniref:Adrenomedullin n=1 Tax=Hippocampus comes TaxID=109280 RepID=A0A3Q2YC15_HIPCM